MLPLPVRVMGASAAVDDVERKVAAAGTAAVVTASNCTATCAVSPGPVVSSSQAHSSGTAAASISVFLVIASPA